MKSANRLFTVVALLVLAAVFSACRPGLRQAAGGANPIPLPTRSAPVEVSSTATRLDCKKIAFALANYQQGENVDIYTICPDGSGLIRLTDHPAVDKSPSWSPNGGKIAFVSARSGSYHIYLINADGSQARQITFDYENSLPAWLPDGRRIAFLSTDGQGLWWQRILDTESGEMKPLSEPSYDFFFQTLAWSPDGRKIAYMSLEEQRERNDGSSQIHVANVDRSDDRPLTNDIWANVKPVWSPDGRQIAFLSERGNYNIFALYVINADGSGMRRISEEQYSEVSAIYSWSPDGKEIVIGDANIGHIWIINLVSGDTREVYSPKEGESAFSPSWQH